MKKSFAEWDLIVRKISKKRLSISEQKKNKLIYDDKIKTNFFLTPQQSKIISYIYIYIYIYMVCVFPFKHYYIEKN